MYNIPNFKENDSHVVEDFIYSHPFALLCGCDEKNKPVATQVPLLLEKVGEKYFLSGHLMRNTDHHRAFLKNEEVLAVFTGPHCYVSATWYENPRQASTWNYMSVHARGSIKFLDEDSLVNVLRQTTLRFENMNEHSSTIFDNLPVGYREHLMPAIVAFQIEVTALENVFKLSQNRDKQSYLNIIAKLNEGDENARKISSEMKMRLHKLFPDH